MTEEAYGEVDNRVDRVYLESRNGMHKGQLRLQILLRRADG